MARFNEPTKRAESATSPVTTEATSSGTTFEGGPGYSRDAESELFMLAVSNMVGQNTFYEGKDERDKRFAALAHVVAVRNPEWMARFLPYLRGTANLRTAPLVAAAESAYAMLDVGIPGSRGMIESVLQRADEPGELLAYWSGKYGRNLPMPVKKGVAEAATRLYDEYAYMKWDSSARGFRFADVLELTHPSPRAPEDLFDRWSADRLEEMSQADREEYAALYEVRKSALFELMLDERHGRGNGVPDVLPKLQANRFLREAAKDDPRVLLDAERLKAAGMTWEDVLSMAGDKLPKRDLWEAIIPSMGYMALLRNLRNFDEAGVSDEVADQVAAVIADPERVRKSRQLPFRFLSAHLATSSLRWGRALERALDVSVENVPVLPGRTLILSDTSGSMIMSTLSERSKVKPAEAAALFATALAFRCGRDNVDFHGFADSTFYHDIPAGGSVLRELERFLRRIGEAGHGTDIAGAVSSTYKAHDRVVVFSDMQTMDPDGRFDPWFHYTGRTSEVKDSVPDDVPVYGWNLMGYEHAAMPTGSRARHELGGFSDSMFKMLPLLEAGRRADWPF